MSKPSKDGRFLFKPRFRDPNKHKLFAWIEKFISAEKLVFILYFFFFLFLSMLFLGLSFATFKKHPNWGLFFFFLSGLSGFLMFGPIFTFLLNPRGFAKMVKDSAEETINKDSNRK